MDVPISMDARRIQLASELPFQLGPGNINPKAHEFVGEHVVVRIQPQTLKVLIALHDKLGRVVSRDELVDRCWDGRVVGDDVINRSISILRGVATRVGGFTIETVPKAGYRLIEAPAASSNIRRNRSALILAAAAVIAASCLYVSGLRRSSLLPAARQAAQPELQVGLAEFTGLSPQVSPSFLRLVREETAAAFAGDGFVGVRMIAVRQPSNVDRYRLSGSVDQQGSRLKVIVRIDNTDTGVSLWSRAFDYSSLDRNEASRSIALNLASITRCAFGRSITYPRTLPDRTLRLLLMGCENDGTIYTNLDRALDYARRVTLTSPDFSAGWSSLAATGVVLGPRKPPPERGAIALESERALYRALRLDPNNSEALALKAYVLPAGRFLERERFLKRAIAARPLDCGCEHHAYGLFLSQVGRLREAEDEYRRALDFMPLNGGLYIGLAMAQFQNGKPSAAQQTLSTGQSLSPHPEDFELLRARFAMWSGDFRRADQILSGETLKADTDAPLLGEVVKALATGNSSVNASTRAALLSLSLDDEQNRPLTISLLAALGAGGNALAAVRRLASTSPAAASESLFDPGFDRVRGDAAFWQSASAHGLVDYWRKSGSRPDLCTTKTAPRICKSLH